MCKIKSNMEIGASSDRPANRVRPSGTIPAQQQPVYKIPATRMGGKNPFSQSGEEIGPQPETAAGSVRFVSRQIPKWFPCTVLSARSENLYGKGTEIAKGVLFCGMLSVYQIFSRLGMGKMLRKAEIRGILGKRRIRFPSWRLKKFLENFYRIWGLLWYTAPRIIAAAEVLRTETGRHDL